MLSDPVSDHSKITNMDIFRQPSYGEDYHKLIRGLRVKAPVLEVNYDNQRINLVIGYEALREAFLDSDRFPPHAMYRFNTEPYVGKTVMSSPEPDHAILRKLSMPAFKLNSVANYGEHLVEDLCIELIESFPENPDLVKDFAQRLPTLVITRMLGLPNWEITCGLLWSNAVASHKTTSSRN